MQEIKSFKAFIEDGLQEYITDFTSNGKCSSCGSCCTNLLPLSSLEIKRISQYIANNNIKEIKTFIPSAIRTIDLTCPFRDNKNKICTIYEVRPAICKLFKCNNSVMSKSHRDKLTRVNKIVDMRREFY